MRDSVEKILEFIFPETCRQQLHRAAEANKGALEKVLCALDECSPALVSELKSDRRSKRRA